MLINNMLCQRRQCQYICHATVNVTANYGRGHCCCTVALRLSNGGILIKANKQNNKKEKENALHAPPGDDQRRK